jgi:hypothetical protein
MTFGRPFREPEDLPRFGERESSEEPQFNHIRCLGLFSSHNVFSFVCEGERPFFSPQGAKGMKKGTGKKPQRERRVMHHLDGSRQKTFADRL